MTGPDERATDERIPDGHSRREQQRSRAERASERLREGIRQLQGRLSEGAQAVAATEGGVAATNLMLAERALREGRLEDARGFLNEAAAALRAVEHERLRADRWPVDPTAGATAAPGATPWRTAARHRDEAALRREQAAQQRDAMADERDRRAGERAATARLRDAAAGRRRAEQARRPGRGPSGRTPGDEQQRAIDAEVEASYREWVADDRARAAADRASDTADRRAAERDRRAAQEDRAAARADREQDSRDRAAAGADRGRSEEPGPPTEACLGRDPGAGPF